ncbi:18S rRNA biogenesis protein RCL1 [Oesophagostomum dentatum]|uniref:18S rRNA biogenesis protein RCL1 n=1 Tax=Oesophagostomum dentatum TaxID=61180 RepID=A0A0B1T3I0_OESDE|nr:18S rRNA biogenesis protein RCL1 [Oesophagostomum dentatum]
MAGEELVFDGCNFFRQRLMYSVLSGRPVTIQNIRKDDDAPGIKDFEAKLLSLLERITNGTKVEINATGTQVRFRPGIITGGVLTMDCGSDRCLSYFLEPMIIISPFCKHPMTLKLKGVTNAPNEISVDAIKATWLPVYNKFVFNDEKLELKISARGLKPAGGGCITFSAPIVKTLRPVQREKSGKVCKIRGQAYVTKVTPSLAYRMIDSAKKMLHGYIADVYITVDQRKGDAGGNSPGYGLFLSAETTEGVVYHGEAISRPKGEPGDPIVPEDVGASAAAALLEEIYRGGCLDSSAQTLASSFMALGQKDISKFLYGPLTVYSVHILRHLKSFFEIQFKVDEWKKLRITDDAKEEEDELRLGSEQKAMVTAMGIGFSNLNKIVL